MTEKRFTIQGRGISDHKRKRLYDLETIDGFISLREVLNELEKENEQLKKVMNELKDMLQRDIDTGVRSYPLQLSEYLVSALEKIGDVE